MTVKTGAYFQGTGRRKTSIARVRLVPGEGNVIVNGKPVDEYFARDGAAIEATAPLAVTNTARRFNAMVKVEGGGVTGQIGAIAHGIARALLQADKENAAVLRKAGHVTRDGRAKERKKPGLKRARKAPQFTKR
ncbi:MAG: 30S ribosomal protein S9 [Chloroflexi bacterium]|nr:30S ribosomal protein S9 [Chloroflexota bacterium]